MGIQASWVLVLSALLFGWADAHAAGVRVLYSLSAVHLNPFPTDLLTVPDAAQNTGLRVNLPLPDCGTQRSSCQELGLVNQLDGFSLQPRIQVRFSGAVNVSTLRSGIFIVWLDKLSGAEAGTRPRGHITAINQVVYDPIANTAYGEADEILDQRRRYVLVVTDAIRDPGGDPVEPDTGFLACVANPFRPEHCTRLEAALGSVAVPGTVAAASLFTTMSATDWMEKARVAIQQSNFDFRRIAPKNTFRVSSLAGIQVKLQVRANPSAFEEISVPLIGLLLPNVDRISFGSFRSPSFLDNRQTIPAVPTGAPVAAPQVSSEILFHAFLPRAERPPAGYPVVIFGHGLNDSRFGAPTLVADVFAKNGFATVAMNATGHGSGPESAISLLEINGAVTTLPTGGRSVDLNGDGAIESREGCVLLEGVPLGLRDCLRQTALDLVQLVRVIRGGVDLDGDGSVDLDPGRIYYAGQSLGALYGTLLTAVEPGIRTSALNVGGGSVIDIARWSPGFRQLAREFLSLRTPPLLNAGADFNEDYVLRNQPVKVTQLPGAIEIQNLFELLEWSQMAGDPLAFAPHFQASPLPGNTEKRVLWQFARGDRTVPNPQNSAVIRASGMRAHSRMYRHDLAAALAPNLSENPHAFLVDIQSVAGGAIANAAQQQMAGFFTSDGVDIPEVNTLVRFLFGRNIFETPSVLPEDLGFGTAVVTVSAASYSYLVAPDSIATAGGRGLATRTEAAPSTSLPVSLAGTTVRVTDSLNVERLAPLFFVSPGQVNYLIPKGAAAGLAVVKVTSGDGTVSTGVAQVERVAPGLFTANADGAGVAAAVALRIAADGTEVYQLSFECTAGPGSCRASPLGLGAPSDRVYLSLYGTGVRGRSSLAAVDVKIGGSSMPVLYAGPQGQLEGLDQINVGPLPRTLQGSGEVTVTLAVDGQPANVTTVSFR